MSRYVIVAHNLTADETSYYGPYSGMNDEINEIYDEIDKYFKKEPDDYNVYIIQLENFPFGCENNRAEE